MVGQKFRHASTMGQGNLGQSWRNLRTCVRRNYFFQTKHHHVRLIVHLNLYSLIELLFAVVLILGQNVMLTLFL